MASYLESNKGFQVTDMNCHHCHAPDQDATADCTSCGKPASGTNAPSRSKKAGRRRHGKRRDADATAHRPPHSEVASYPPPALLAGPHDARERPEPASYPLALSLQVHSSAAEGSANKRHAHRPWRRWAAGSLVVVAAALAFTGLSRTKENTAVIEARAAMSSAVDTTTPPLADSAQGKITKATTGTDGSRQSATQKNAPATTSKPVKSTPMAHATPPKRQQAQSEQKKRETAIARTVTKPATAPVTAERTDGLLLASKAPVPQSKYEQCLQQDSFLSRERCKWQACSGKWGQDGCPSYQQKTDIN